MYDIHDDILYPAQISGLVLFPITATICVLYINAYNDHILYIYTYTHVKYSSPNASKTKKSVKCNSKSTMVN